MIEICIHGRGGQGAVIASKLIAEAAFRGGIHVQAFPSFGSERRGAPVTAFVRISQEPIRVHSEIYQPDSLIVLDPSLLELESIDVTAGLKEGGCILINSGKDPQNFPKLQRFHVATVNASGIALKLKLGSATAPIVNTVMAGAFLSLTGIADLENLSEAIRGSVPVKVEENVAAARQGALELRGKRLKEGAA